MQEQDWTEEEFISYMQANEMTEDERESIMDDAKAEMVARIIGVHDEETIKKLKILCTFNTDQWTECFLIYGNPERTYYDTDGTMSEEEWERIKFVALFFIEWDDDDFDDLEDLLRD